MYGSTCFYNICKLYYIPKEKNPVAREILKFCDAWIVLGHELTHR